MDKLLQFLLSKNSYDEKPFSIKHYETHISHVFVTDKYAYKVKKPVKFDFLDFSTLKKRLLNCKREVLLNSRLAKGYYLGVYKIYEKDGALSFKPSRGSKVYEYVVKMKRLCEDKILSNLITEGETLLPEIILVAKKISHFHKKGKPYRGSYFGGINVVRKDNQENIEEVSSYVGKTITRREFNTIREFTENFINNNKKIFVERKHSGYIKNIHGDLHTNHIVLSKPMVIFDCIEFNKRLSIGDLLEDIGFLLMDLEFRGRFDLSKAVYKTYFSYNPDCKDDDLLRFYKVYRAVVRGKIESFTSDVLPTTQKSVSLKKARDYFSLACHYIQNDDKSFNPLIFMGVSGSGKSSVAHFFRKKAVVLRSDVIRKEISHIKATSHSYTDIETGIYSKEMTERTYRRLLELSIENCKAGSKVILDATFLKCWQRSLFLDMLIKAGLNPLFVYFTAPETTLFERVLLRKKKANDVSDADLNVLQYQLKTMEQPDELPSFRVLKIKNVSTPETVAKNIEELF